MRNDNVARPIIPNISVLILLDCFFSVLQEIVLEFVALSAVTFEIPVSKQYIKGLNSKIRIAQLLINSCDPHKAFDAF